MITEDIDLILTTKNKVKSILKTLNKFGKKHPYNKSFAIRKIKNNRGDYGYNDLYFYNGVLFLVSSIDGARIDVRFYITKDTEKVLGELKWI